VNWSPHQPGGRYIVSHWDTRGHMSGHMLEEEARRAWQSVTSYLVVGWSDLSPPLARCGRRDQRSFLRRTSASISTSSSRVVVEASVPNAHAAASDVTQVKPHTGRHEAACLTAAPTTSGPAIPYLGTAEAGRTKGPGMVRFDPRLGSTADGRDRGEGVAHPREQPEMFAREVEVVGAEALRVARSAHHREREADGRQVHRREANGR
jgi:hypothetical protein